MRAEGWRRARTTGPERRQRMKSGLYDDVARIERHRFVGIVMCSASDHNEGWVGWSLDDDDVEMFGDLFVDVGEARTDMSFPVPASHALAHDAF